MPIFDLVSQSRNLLLEWQELLVKKKKSAPWNKRCGIVQEYVTLGRQSLVLNKKKETATVCWCKHLCAQEPLSLYSTVMHVKPQTVYQ